jgi:hypothetical protein
LLFLVANNREFFENVERDGNRLTGTEFIIVLDKHRCACRKSNPDILVVQPAENWAAKNVPGPLDDARDRRILLQG